MTADLQTASPAYSKTYTLTMSTSAYADPFDFDSHYPNPVDTIGSLLATEKSSGNLFQLVSFDCKTENGYTPSSATAVVAIDDNDVESFTKKFDKSNESMKKKFDKLEDHFVYTMTETSTPDRVIAPQSSDNIISLMYTLQTGIYLQDEDTGDIISVADISSISTAGNKLQVTINSRSLQKSVLDEMNTAFSTTSGLCDISYSASATNVTSEVLKLKAADADVVMFSSYTADAILFMQTFKEQNYYPKMLVGQRGGFSRTEMFQTVPEAMQSVYNTCAWASDLDQPNVPMMCDLYQEVTGNPAQDGPMRAMTDFSTPCLAINQAASTDPAAIREKLAAVGYIYSSDKNQFIHQ